jgi:hypothetical protein
MTAPQRKALIATEKKKLPLLEELDQKHRRGQAWADQLGTLTRRLVSGSRAEFQMPEGLTISIDTIETQCNSQT